MPIQAPAAGRRQGMGHTLHVAAAALGLLAACADEPSCPATTTEIQRDVLAVRCGGSLCHGGTTPQAGLDLVSAGLEERLVGVPAAECGGILVVPGDPESSYLYAKLTEDTPDCGNRMPLGGSLPADELACVRTWIAGLPPGPALPDAGLECADGTSLCDGACVDTETDPLHCGACGRICDAACSAGECVAMCPEPTENCAGACVDLRTSSEHCGACGRTCESGQVCSAGDCSCGTQVSFAGDIQPIFDADCNRGGCHGGASPAGGLDLTAGRAYQELVDAASEQCSGRVRVVPGDAEASYLYDKLVGVDLCAGSRMPKGAAPLGPADTDAIRAWICAGANQD